MNDLNAAYDVIVVGGGPAGVTAALRARELGASVALVERGRMGGVCTNDGCVPTRVLAHAARLARDAGQFGWYGLSAVTPEVDFARLVETTQKVVDTIHEKKQLLKHLAEVGGTVLDQAGAAQFSGTHSLRLGNGRELYGEKFILCAGGHARRISFPGSELAMTHSDVWSLKHLPRSMVIVGGAATGCQVAAIFAAFGTQVTVLETSPRILALEDEAISKVIQKSFQSKGVRVITGISGVSQIVKLADGLRLDYSAGGAEHSVEAESAVLSVGWVGNLEGLNLEAAGVKQERGYIPVSDYLQTSAAHIFAAGDITGRMMLVQSASYDGRIAAENAVLGVGQPYRHEIVPHGGFTDPEYGSVGLTEVKARERGEIVTATVSYRELDRAVIDGHTEGVCKLVVSLENHRILGAHVAGEQALEVIQIAAAGMAADMWIEQLAELELPYPTYTAIIGLAARRVMRILGVLPIAPEWHALGEMPLAEWERGDAIL